MCSPKEMATMTENDPAGSTPPPKEEPALSRQEEPGTSQPAEDPGSRPFFSACGPRGCGVSVNA